MADHRHGRRPYPPRSADDLTAFGDDDRRVLGQQADELWPAGACEIAAREPALADIVRLALVDDPAHAEIERGHRPVGVVADRDIALLGAQHVYRLGAERRDAMRPARRHE